MNLDSLVEAVSLFLTWFLFCFVSSEVTPSVIGLSWDIMIVSKPIDYVGTSSVTQPGIPVTLLYPKQVF